MPKTKKSVTDAIQEIVQHIKAIALQLHNQVLGSVQMYKV